MLSEEAKNSLEKQQYRIIGNHSAVKTCGWTKKMIKGEGGCYKLKFYGIMSNQCLQMTTSISCANRCTFCWRDYKAPVSKEWKWDIDDTELILKQSKEAHHKLLVGFKGNKNSNKSAYEASKNIKHVALSLTGEPIMYPNLNELLTLFNKEDISTFLVTNAQYPEQIKDLAPITQLYISLDAPNKKLLEEVDLPLFKDYWERLQKSLEYLAVKKQRTCIRLTLIKDVNMISPSQYASLINKGNPDFIEIKAYMYVGASKERLKAANMPSHEEIVDYSKQLLQFLPTYDIASEHVSSRVVMLAKRKFKINDKWHTWINFKKYNELINSSKEFSTEDYLAPLPLAYEFGKKKSNLEITSYEAKQKHSTKIDESTQELDFWKE